MSQMDIGALLDDIEKSYRIVRASTDPRARITGSVSTGLLSLDLFLGGGYIGGAWYTYYGMEQSGKSTAVSTAMASLAMANVKGTYWDFEGSSSPQFQANIISKICALQDSKSDITIDKVFGVMDDKGKYIVPPIFRLYTESIGDKMFDAMSRLAKVLPDKVFEQGKWWYVYDKKPTEGKINKALSSRGAYYVEAEHVGPEVAIFLDSYSAMYPENLDEGKGQGMAAVARMFSENIPKILGRLKKKGILIIGVNQLRLKPAVMFGCFQGSSLVTMADGSLIPIADIVKTKNPGPVMSYDKKTGKVVAKRIKNWYINGQTENGWLKFVVEGGNKKGNGQRTFKVTPNHLLMRGDGKMQHAGDFKVGDTVRLVSDTPSLSDVQKQLEVVEGVIRDISPWACYKGFASSKDRGYEDSNKYDLEIEDTHLYCVDGVIVHNSPEYEPNGEAVKFASSCRIKLAKRAVPHGKGKFEEEGSVIYDGNDVYQYIHLSMPDKNKLYSSVGLESWQRIWKADPNGEAHGFDPVWNVYDYLLLTGQATRFGTGKKRVIDFSIKDTKGEKVLYEGSLDWWDFKALILLQGKERLSYAKELGMEAKEYKTLFADSNLFNHCRSQILDGCAIRMAYAVKNGIGLSDDDDIEEDDEE